MATFGCGWPGEGLRLSPPPFLLVLFLLLALQPLLYAGVGRACNFPDYMRTNGSEKEWRTRIRNQYMQHGLNVSVSGRILQATAIDDPTSESYTWVCVQRYDQNKYLVSQEQSGQQGQRYTCVQFIQRSPVVIQLRKAEISEKMQRSLCDDDSLLLDDWILVDYSQLMNQRETCSFRGGYSIHIYNRLNGESRCGAFEGHMRLESECVESDDLMFYFRQGTCIPDGLHMYPTQRVICAANWQEGPYSYSLLRNDVYEQAWMLRYMTMARDSSVAFLLNDLVADRGTHITETRHYYRLDTVRNTPIPVTSLCMDEYEACYTNEACGHSERMVMTCPRSCGLCNATRPRMCTFPNSFHGTWKDIGHSEAVAVTVNSSMLTVHGHHSFHCVQWDLHRDDNPRSDNSHTDVMMVTTFDNGCRPRYTCARFLQKGTSTLFFQISESRAWPLTESPNQPIDCSQFNYEQGRLEHPNPYRTRHSKLLYSSNPHAQVPCGLPDYVKDFRVSLKTGTNCGSDLTENRASTALHLNLHGCNSSSGDGGRNHHKLEGDFTCLESSRLWAAGDLLIITRTSHRSSEIYCWIFPKRLRSTFYLVEGRHCNEATKKRIRRRKFTPLATFSKPVKPSAVLPRAQNGTEPEPPLVVASAGGGAVTPGDGSAVAVQADNNKSSVNSTATQDKKQENVSSTPFVVVAAVVFFAVFQIPCACHSS